MAEQEARSRSDAILVVGGGIAGMTTAIEAAEVGHDVYLVERTPSLGGRVAQTYQYFPKLCPPICGLEINYRRIRENPKVKVFTQAELHNVTGTAGEFTVTLRLWPRCVNERCAMCGQCLEACPVERESVFNYGMDVTKAIYLPHAMAFPLRYVIDVDVCKGTSCAKCVAACPYGAIDLQMKPTTLTLNVGAIVVATGWAPYDATALDGLGFGQHKDVITNVMMERLAAPDGPTGGKILRPSNGEPVQTAVFVQCAGSRDENHLPYCSSVCCLASMKQATYLRAQNPDSKAHIFYIDLRASGVQEDFLTKVQADDNIDARKGKVAKVEEEPETGRLTVEVEDILGGGKTRVTADLVVLATGMTPSPSVSSLPLDLKFDEYGFCAPDGQPDGVVVTGTAKRPADVVSTLQDATGAALAAIQMARRGD